MSYVRTDTSNSLGRRGLARLGKLGWGDSAPYPVYGVSRAVARLNGQFNPPGADPSTNTNGAITYRIDPQTGQYRFYSTDIKPRGVFAPNMYQPLARPVMTALGVPIVRPQQRGRRFAPRGRSLSGLGCNCGGRCSGANLSRLGEADFPGACGPQSDGTIIPCGPDPSMATEQTNPPAPGTQRTTIDLVGAKPNTVVTPAGVPFIVNVSAGQQQLASWWDGYTMIAGARVPNPALAIGGVGFLFVLAGLGKGKR